MRVMVTGSRDWTAWSIVWKELSNPLLVTDHKTPTLVHGVARGADELAANAATRLGWVIERHPADWMRWGKAAGAIRNAAMLDSGIDRVVAFQLNGSRGTQNAIDGAVSRGIPTAVWSVGERGYSGAVRRVLVGA